MSDSSDTDDAPSRLVETQGTRAMDTKPYDAFRRELAAQSLDAVVYARESLDRAGKSENCDVQIAECQEFCDERGFNVVAVLRDNDISASRFSKKPRKDYITLIELVRANKVQVIVVTETTRLYRKLEELIDLFRLAETTRYSYLMSTSGAGYDLSAAEGRHSAIASVNDAILESEKLSMRQKRYERVRAKNGRYHGGQRPYGWEGAQRDEKGRVLNPGRIGIYTVPEEAANIKEWAERIIAGQSLNSVVFDNNRRGIPTARGGKWSPNGLKLLLRNPRLIGIRRHHDKEYPAEWEPILDRETFDRLQLAIRVSPQRAKGENKKRARVNLLTGFVFCGLCGKALAPRVSKPRDSRPYRSYWCAPYDYTGTPHGCGKIGRIAEPIDLLVGDAIRFRLQSAQLTDIVERLLEEPEDVAVTKETADRILAAKNRKEELKTAYATGRVKLADYLDMEALIEAEITSLTGELERRSETQLLAELINRPVEEAWTNADLDQRRVMVSLLINKVIIHPGRTGKRWKHEETGKSWQFNPDLVEIDWRV